MRVYLVRHAEAQPQAETDAMRQLTELGHAQAEAASQWLKDCCAEQSVSVLASPYVRAQMTAQHIADALAVTIHTVAELSPDHDPLRAEKSLMPFALQDTDVLVVISHMPLIASLHAWLRDNELISGTPYDLCEVRTLDFEVFAAGLGQESGGYLPQIEMPSKDLRWFIASLKGEKSE